MTRAPLLAAAALAAFAWSAQAASHPADATGRCKDGTYTREATRAKACAGHRGLRTWYGHKAPSERTQPTENLAPDKPTQSINSTVSGDRKNNTQPTDRR